MTLKHGDGECFGDRLMRRRASGAEKLSFLFQYFSAVDSAAQKLVLQY
jgi:hypothetical protein